MFAFVMYGFYSLPYQAKISLKLSVFCRVGNKKTKLSTLVNHISYPALFFNLRTLKCQIMYFTAGA